MSHGPRRFTKSELLLFHAAAGPVDQYGARDKYGGVGTDYHTYQKHEGEIVYHLTAQDKERRDNKERRKRRKDRPRERLIYAGIYDRLEVGTLHETAVLPYPVEDDYRIIDRVSYHCQERGYDREGYLPPCDSDGAQADKDIMKERGDRGDREFEFKAQRDIDAYAYHSVKEGPGRLILQVLTYGRSHSLYAEDLEWVPGKNLSEFQDNRIGCIRERPYNDLPVLSKLLYR